MACAAGVSDYVGFNMGTELYWMLTIIDRRSIKKFTKFYAEYGAETNLVTYGYGTASHEVLDLLGFDSTEKAILYTVVTGNVWKDILRNLRSRMRIDVPGIGIVFIIPISAVGGKRQLQYLTAGLNFKKSEEESALKDTRYELLIVIAEQGYSDMVMDAARGAGAGGGTVVHSRGTGVDRSEQLLGVTIAKEKELILIVVKTKIRNAVMSAIMEHAGINTKAKAIAFSLPVTETAGMRLLEDDFEEEVEGLG